MIRAVSIQFIFYLHIACIVFLIFGWLLPKAFLIPHMVFIPLVILQWRFNSNQCVLTQLQQKLEGKTLNREEEGQFVKELFKKLNFEPSDRQLNFIIYGLFIISFVISSFRLASF